MNKKSIIILFTSIILSFFAASKSWAFCFCTSCDCSTLEKAHEDIEDGVASDLSDYFEEFKSDFVNGYLVKNIWWPALKKFVEQINMSAEKAFVEIPGKQMDARIQKAAQDKIAQQKIDAIMETAPDEETCKMVSLSKSLSYSVRLAKASRSYLGQQGINRSLGLAGDPASRGSSQERLLRFQESAPYFDDKEMNGALEDFALASTPRRKGADVSPHTLFGRKTLNIDYADTTVTDDEKDIFMLKSNLYNNKTLTNVSPHDFSDPENYDEYDEMEVITAFQALAEYSFDYIASLKVMGDDSAGQVLPAVLEELGVSATTIADMTFGSNRPSYMQLMEVLSKTLQMSPSTHVKNSGETAELLRRMAIKEGIELMVKFEILQSHKRAASLVTALHELERREFQEEWENSAAFHTGGR